MGMFKQLWEDKKVECPSCHKGILEPRFPNISPKENHQFICSHCGIKVTAVLKMPIE